jgi:hypothetical protein
MAARSFDEKPPAGVKPPKAIFHNMAVRVVKRSETEDAEGRNDDADRP